MSCSPQSSLYMQDAANAAAAASFDHDKQIRELDGDHEKGPRIAPINLNVLSQHVTTQTTPLGMVSTDAEAVTSTAAWAAHEASAAYNEKYNHIPTDSVLQMLTDQGIDETNEYSETPKQRREEEMRLM